MSSEPNADSIAEAQKPPTERSVSPPRQIVYFGPLVEGTERVLIEDVNDETVGPNQTRERSCSAGNVCFGDWLDEFDSIYLHTEDDDDVDADFLVTGTIDGDVLYHIYKIN